MPGEWKGSNRRSELPPNWEALRKACFARDSYRCTEIMYDGTRCPRVATDCDHIGDKHDHRLEMLTSKCGPHHAKKSAMQGVEARRARREARLRPVDKNPAQLRSSGRPAPRG